METIHITGSDETIRYHEFYRPYKCTANLPIPAMLNRGFNTYAFATPVNFTWENMPLVLKFTTKTFEFYEATIEVFDPTGRKVMGFYSKIVRIDNREIVEEKVDFS